MHINHNLRPEPDLCLASIEQLHGSYNRFHRFRSSNRGACRGLQLRCFYNWFFYRSPFYSWFFYRSLFYKCRCRTAHKHERTNQRLDGGHKGWNWGRRGWFCSYFKCSCGSLTVLPKKAEICTSSYWAAQQWGKRRRKFCWGGFRTTEVGSWWQFKTCRVTRVNSVEDAIWMMCYKYNLMTVCTLYNRREWLNIIWDL